MKVYLIWPPKLGRDSFFYDWPREFLYLGPIMFEWVGDKWPYT